MVDLTERRIGVIGAGVFGLCVALRAAAAGAAVTVFDPAPGDNASSVAAGMIAPVGETVFDAAAEHHLLFQAGADGWAGLQALAPDLRIERAGAVFHFADLEAQAAAETRLGALGVRWTQELDGAGPGLFVSGEASVAAPAGLAALRAAVLARGGRLLPEPFEPARVDQGPAFDALVLAAGYDSRRWAALAPELAGLSPIKGQLVTFAGGPARGPVRRTPELYLAPHPGGLIAGATMEFGRDDRRLDPALLSELRARALALAPELGALAFFGSAGVRAATTDGLPMAGPSSRRGLYLATGARRNGWLLAPLVSQILVSYLSGGDGGPFAAALHPLRFSAP